MDAQRRAFAERAALAEAEREKAVDAATRLELELQVQREVAAEMAADDGKPEVRARRRVVATLNGTRVAGCAVGGETCQAGTVRVVVEEVHGREAVRIAAATPGGSAP